MVDPVTQGYHIFLNKSDKLASVPTLYCYSEADSLGGALTNWNVSFSNLSMEYFKKLTLALKLACFFHGASW